VGRVSGTLSFPVRFPGGGFAGPRAADVAPASRRDGRRDGTASPAQLPKVRASRRCSGRFDLELARPGAASRASHTASRLDILAVCRAAFCDRGLRSRRFRRRGLVRRLPTGARAPSAAVAPLPGPRARRPLHHEHARGGGPAAGGSRPARPRTVRHIFRSALPRSAADQPVLGFLAALGSEGGNADVPQPRQPHRPKSDHSCEPQGRDSRQARPGQHHGTGALPGARRTGAVAGALLRAAHRLSPFERPWHGPRRGAFPGGQS
jgi:hypothetical protein